MTTMKILEIYNPLDKRNIGENAADALIRTSPEVLPPESFIGAGVYAIYYNGPFAAYAELAKMNATEWKIPIYVGKAVPIGARKGGVGSGDNQGTVLADRLKDHYKSINAADNLNISDFRCKYLAVDDIWIPLTESILIEKYHPLWNVTLDGFGNHDPGKGRANQKKSPWDTIHPGRDWANKLAPSSTSKAELLKRISAYMMELKKKNKVI